MIATIINIALSQNIFVEDLQNEESAAVSTKLQYSNKHLSKISYIKFTKPRLYQIICVTHPKS